MFLTSVPMIKRSAFELWINDFALMQSQCKISICQLKKIMTVYKKHCLCSFQIFQWAGGGVEKSCRCIRSARREWIQGRGHTSPSYLPLRAVSFVFMFTATYQVVSQFEWNNLDWVVVSSLGFPCWSWLLHERDALSACFRHKCITMFLLWT